MARTRTDEHAIMRVEDAIGAGMAEAKAGRFKSARAQFEQAAAVCAARVVGRRKLPEFPRFELPDENDPRYSGSLERGLTILALFTEADPMWGVADVAGALGEQRSTTHRYLTTLVRIGYLTQEGTAGRKYRRVIADA